MFLNVDRLNKGKKMRGEGRTQDKRHAADAFASAFTIHAITERGVIVHYRDKDHRLNVYPLLHTFGIAAE